MAVVIEHEVNDLVERVIERLRAEGRRITTSRRVLLQCLFAGERHRTVEELAADVQSVAPDIHLSTIYRNLDELEHYGIIEHVHLGHGPATYHLAGEDHGHLVCSECGRTIEVPDTLFRSLMRGALADYDFRVDTHHFATIGKCGSCSTA